jgi:hypothetical protein
MKQKTRNSTLAISIAFLALLGCEYDVPITSEPTRKIEPTLLGDWTSTHLNNNDCKERLKVRKYDESSYIISLDGNLHRAWHSDVADIPFITVQNLDSPQRKYSYFRWTLSDDGKGITLHRVNSKLIPEDTRDSATVVNILRANVGNSKLFEDETRFTRNR